jgi:hypothetical protein
VIKLELVKMPTDYSSSGYGMPTRSSRRYLITINDVIVEDLREYKFTDKGRTWWDTFVCDRVRTFEKALGVRANKIRGADPLRE